MGQFEKRCVFFFVSMLGLGLATGALGAETDVLQWIPADTRIVMQIDPAAAARQPRAREALGMDALLGASAALRELAAASRRITVAYVRTGGSAGLRPVLFYIGAQSLEARFARLHGEALGLASGQTFYREAGTENALALLSPTCIVEGTPQAIRAVLDLRSTARQRLADLAPEAPARRLLAGSRAQFPLALCYLAPNGGTDLHAMLRDLDRTLQGEMGAALEAYKPALRLLGTAHGLRFDLRQQQQALATSIHLAMPNKVAAQLASASLQAGREMASLASDAAVRAHSMTPADAKALDAVLATMTTSASGDFVQCDVTVAEPSQIGIR